MKVPRESPHKLLDFVLFAPKYMIFHYLKNTSEGHTVPLKHQSSAWIIKFDVCSQ